MSDPRDLEGDPNSPRDRFVGRRSANQGAGWIIAAVIVAIVLGIAAYNMRGGNMSASNEPGTTSGESTRAPAPVPVNPPAPVTQAPAPPPARSQ